MRRVAKTPFPDLRSSTFDVGGQRMLVISYAAGERAPTRLTATETEVARMAASGTTNAEIARKRGSSVRTVANQMASILEKLGLASRRELSVFFQRGSLEDGESEA